MVKSVFEGCPRRDSEKPSPVGVPSHHDVRAAVFADSEATSSSMVLEVKQASIGVLVRRVLCLGSDLRPS